MSSTAGAEIWLLQAWLLFEGLENKWLAILPIGPCKQLSYSLSTCFLSKHLPTGHLPTLKQGTCKYLQLYDV